MAFEIDPATGRIGPKLGRIEPPPIDPFETLTTEERLERLRHTDTLAETLEADIVSYRRNLQRKRTRRDFYEDVLFQNLIPAFDDIPIRRVFPVCLYTPDHSRAIHAQFAVALLGIIEASECHTVESYPVLHGSKVYRGLLQTRQRQTRAEFELLHSQQMATLINALAATKGTATISFSPKSEWAEQLKAFTDSVRNLLAIGALVTLFFDGHVLSKTEHLDDQAPVVRQLDRQAQLKIVPEILDAEKAEDVQKIIESLESPKAQKDE